MNAPTQIVRVELAREDSIRPASGLRYGNFEGVVHLPPLERSSKTAGPNLTTLNNQQIYKTVREWFEPWRPWQKKTLLYGVADKCSIHQLDILVTSLEPLRHRDYKTIVNKRYPSADLRRPIMSVKPKRKSEKKLPSSRQNRRKTTASSLQSKSSLQHVNFDLNDSDSVSGTPNSARRKRISTQRKRSGVRKGSTKATTSMPETLQGFAEKISDNILEEVYSTRLTVSKTGEVWPETKVEKLSRELSKSIISSIYSDIGAKQESQEKNVENEARKREKSPQEEFGNEEPKGADDSRTNEQLASDGNITNNINTAEEALLDSRDSNRISFSNEAEILVLDQEIVGLKDIITDQTYNDNDVIKMEKDRKLSVNSEALADVRVLSRLSQSSIANIRHTVFGSSSANTPDFFHDDQWHVLGPMKRKLQRTPGINVAKVELLPVSAQKSFKHSKWWGNIGKTGDIYVVAKNKLLKLNFREQLMQIWEWLSEWEDYEKINLMKEVMKMCDDDLLSSLGDYIQQRVKDRLDINRLTDKLLLYIFSFLTSDEIGAASQVCRRWRYLCAVDDLWMIKCHEMGLREGVNNLPDIVRNCQQDGMSIDWKMAYGELEQLTKMMKKGLNQCALTDEEESETEESYTESPKNDSQTPKEPMNRRLSIAYEIDFRRGTLSRIRLQEELSWRYRHLKEIDDSDEASEDLSAYLNEYSLLRQTTPDQKKHKYRRRVSYYHQRKRSQMKSQDNGGSQGYTPTTDNDSDEETEKPALKKTANDDEDTALDIRPDLNQAQDLMGKATANRSLVWQEPDSSQKPSSGSFAGVVQSVKRVRKLQGHLNSIMCLQFDSRRLVTAGLDRTVRIWDIRSGRSIHKLYGHKGGIRCLCFDDEYLATGAWDTTVMVWDMKYFTRFGTLHEHTDCVSCVQMNKKYIVSGSHDATVRVWTRRTLYCATVIRGHTKPITSMILDEDCVISGSMDMTLRQSDLESGECLRVFDEIQNPILSVWMQEDLLITASPSGQVSFWNKSSRECEATIQCHDKPINCLAFHRGRFFTASSDFDVKEWDLRTMTCVRVLHGHKGPVRCVQASSNYIVSCSDDGTIKIWDLKEPISKGEKFDASQSAARPSVAVRRSIPGDKDKKASSTRRSLSLKKSLPTGDMYPSPQTSLSSPVPTNQKLSNARRMSQVLNSAKYSNASIPANS